jgi:hypothetical protein
MLRVNLNFFKKTRYSSDLRYPGRIVESGIDVAGRFRLGSYMFGEAYMYLFFFNEDGTISKVWGLPFILN